MEELKWLIDLAQTAGGASGPIFAIMWLLERRDRRQKETERLAELAGSKERDDKLFEKIIASASTMTATVAALGVEQQEGRRTLESAVKAIENLTRRRA